MKIINLCFIFLYFYIAEADPVTESDRTVSYSIVFFLIENLLMFKIAHISPDTQTAKCNQHRKLKIINEIIIYSPTGDKLGYNLQRIGDIIINAINRIILFLNCSNLQFAK